MIEVIIEQGLSSRLQGYNDSSEAKFLDSNNSSNHINTISKICIF